MSDKIIAWAAKRRSCISLYVCAYLINLQQWGHGLHFGIELYMSPPTHQAERSKSNESLNFQLKKYMVMYDLNYETT